MAKSMKVPVLIFDHHDEIKILMGALDNIKDSNDYSQVRRKEIKELLNEICKINAIFETTNNN